MSGTEEDTENISAPRDKSLDQHWGLGAVDPRTPFAKVATLESVKIEFSEFSKVPEPLKNKNKTPNLSLRPIRGLEMIF